MAKCQVTIFGGDLAFKTPFDRSFIYDLKDEVPSQYRKWNGKGENPSNVWLIDPEYGLVVIKLIQQYYNETLSLPQIQKAAPVKENREFTVRYVGGVKTRDDGQKLAYGLVLDQWVLIFSEEVLKEWFEGRDVDQGGSRGTLFSILGLSSTSATDDEIKKAYRRMALQWHPDHCHEPDATERFIDIKEAYDVLSNSMSRKRYMAGLYFSEQKEERISGRKSAHDWSDYKPPLRCGVIKTRGYFMTGRFVVEKIVQWDDITDGFGNTLVTSWDMTKNNGRGAVVEEWSR